MRIRTIALVAVGVVVTRALVHRLRPAVLVTARTVRDADSYDDVLDTDEDVDAPINRSHGYLPTEALVREGRP